MLDIVCYKLDDSWYFLFMNSGEKSSWNNFTSERTSVSRARISTVARIPFITRDRAQELIAEAKKSVASAQDNFTGQLVVSTIEHILQRSV